MTSLRVAHVITGLGVGGAEMMLLRLLPRLEERGVESLVISIKAEGELAPVLRAKGIPVVSVDLTRPSAFPKAAIALAQTLREYRPHAVQTWMYHADLIGGLAGRGIARAPVVWNLRTTTPGVLAGRQRLVRSCATLSRHVPESIVCCSETAVEAHAAFGYDRTRMIVIHNGFDLDELRPDPEARAEVRRELHIPDDALVVGLVARFDPLKDHENFVRAAARLCLVEPRSVFVLCGDGTTLENATLRDWIEREGVLPRFRLLGRRNDIRRINAAFDIATCTSVSEGMPNVVAEAMACGVPCVVTDVGDSALLVGGTGLVVPPSNSQALAEGWTELLKQGRPALRSLGLAARAVIQKRFSLEMSVEKYAQLYRRVAR